MSESERAAELERAVERLAAGRGSLRFRELRAGDRVEVECLVTHRGRTRAATVPAGGSAAAVVVFLVAKLDDDAGA